MNKLIHTDTKKAYFSKNFNYIFDKQDGQTIMWGETYKDDPEVGPFNMIVDFEITERCGGIGNYGPCKFCYKSNTPYSGYVTSFEDEENVYLYSSKELNEDNIFDIEEGLFNLLPLISPKEKDTEDTLEDLFSK